MKCIGAPSFPFRRILTCAGCATPSWRHFQARDFAAACGMTSLSLSHHGTGMPGSFRAFLHPQTLGSSLTGRTSSWISGGDDKGFNPKNQKRMKRWHERDEATDEERLVYYGPWADSVRWMQASFQSLATVSATVLAGHFTGVAPMLEIGELGDKSMSLDDSLGLCLGILAFAALGRAVISTIVVRLYRDELEHDYRAIKVGFLPWRSSSFRLECGDLKPIKWGAFEQFLFRNPEKKIFVIFDHRFRYPQDFNRLLGYAGGLYEDDDDVGTPPRPSA